MKLQGYYYGAMPSFIPYDDPWLWCGRCGWSGRVPPFGDVRSALRAHEDWYDSARCKNTQVAS